MGGWILIVFVFLFAFVVFFGAPYLPSKKRQIEVALEMLGAGKGKVLVDLGSGDGAFLKAAAKRGAEVYGYELNPILCVISWLRCFKYRKQVHIKLANFWITPLPKETTGVYTFLLHRYMKRLDMRMNTEAVRLKHTVKLASFTFAIPGKQAVDVQDGVFLYRYEHKL